MTPWEFSLVMENRRRENAEKWRKFRWIGVIILNVFRKKGSSPITPEKFMPLPEIDDLIRSNPGTLMDTGKFHRLSGLWNKKRKR